MPRIVRKPNYPSGKKLWPVLSALPDLGIASFYLLNLMKPGVFGSWAVSYLVLLVYVEFFVIFSAGFLAMLLVSKLGRMAKSALFLAMSAGYISAITVVGLRFDQTWPVWAFCALTLNRLAGIFLNSDPDDRSVYARDGWLVCFAIYFAAAYVAANSGLSGIFDKSLAEVGFADINHWYLDPNRMVLLGLIYFSCVGVFGIVRNHFQFYWR